MKKVLILCFAFASFAAFGQSAKLKKANDYYDNLAYAYAANLYEELIGSEYETPMVKVNLGRSYYYMGDMVNAEKYLATIINSAVAKNDDLFLYAQALKQNGKIELSDEWMNKFRNKAAGDIRGESFSKNPDYLEKIVAKGLVFEIKNLNINTSRSDFGGYPGPKSGESFFVSNRKERALVKNIWTWNKTPYLDLYKSNVTTNRELENVDMLRKKVNSRWHEGPLAFTPDGKTVYFTRNNVAKGKSRRDIAGHQNLKLYKATVDENGKWLNEQEIPFNSKEYSVGHPTISPDGKILYFVSDMPGGFGGADIYQAEIKADGSLGSPSNMGKQINTEGQDMFPWVSVDGTLFFASNGHIGLGGLDIFAIFPKKGEFTNLINVGLPVNSESDDFAFIMNKDGSTGYFSSNRADGKGDDDIYSYKLLAPLKPNLILEGLITDNRSKLILPNAEVILVDAEGNMIESAKSDGKGFYSFNLEPDMDYQVMAAKEKYFDNKAAFTTKNLGEVTVIHKDLPLDQDPGLGLYALVTDGKTNEPLKGVRMKITDKITGKTFIETVTPGTGDALKTIVDQKVGEFVNYDISLMKEGYFPKTINFKTKIEKAGIIPVHQLLEGGLTLDPAVKDLKDLVQINDIRFDLNKYNIRPDAAIELDKIVAVMNKYPEMEVELGSHTDCRASYAYNEKLSDQRAKASAAYIKSRISNPDRIYGKGYGESILLNGCACEGNVKSDCSEEEHEKNRRTEFKVIKAGGDIEIQNNSTNSFGE